MRQCTLFFDTAFCHALLKGSLEKMEMHTYWCVYQWRHIQNMGVKPQCTKVLWHFSNTLFRLLYSFAFFVFILFFASAPDLLLHLKHTMSNSDNIKALSDQFQALRSVKGHYQGGDFNEQTDAPNGAKHHAMKVTSAPTNVYWLYCVYWLTDLLLLDSWRAVRSA
jgi:hypothetical protein